MRRLRLEVRRSGGLTVIGQTGVGKSSLLRAMAGLWRLGAGSIVMPPIEQCLFIPQRPYMILSNLRSQLLYPRGDGNVSDARLQAALERVRLPDLVARHGGFDAVLDWSKVLSLGEQQRHRFPPNPDLAASVRFPRRGHLRRRH